MLSLFFFLLTTPITLEIDRTTTTKQPQLFVALFSIIPHNCRSNRFPHYDFFLSSPLRSPHNSAMGQTAAKDKQRFEQWVALLFLMDPT